MTAGRTVWWPKDSAWWRRERVVELGEELGAEGPAVIDFLSCEAAAQNDGGRVKTGYRSVARGCFVELVTVRHVVSRAVTLGVLDDFEEGGNTFVCRMSGWQEDNARGKAAARQAAARGRREAGSQGAEPNDDADQGVTDRDESRPVTPRHAEAPTSHNHTSQSEQSSDKAGRRSTVADQDQLPADFPEHLAAPAAASLTKLTALWGERGGNAPTLRGVGLALRRFPDRDHQTVLAELEHWALAGRGARQTIKDWPRTLATFLERAPVGRPAHLRPVGGTGTGQQWRQLLQPTTGPEEGAA